MLESPRSRPMLIGVVGLIGSGKDTVAEYLVAKQGFHRISFANSLKDAVSVIFSWPRDLLEGRTPEAREWREVVDQWWANRLSIPHLTPRWVLQNIGTEVFRKSFHSDIWVASAERQISLSNSDIVISDCRFANEIKSIRNANGIIVRVKRGNDPVWWQYAVENNEHMAMAYPDVHESEYAWASQQFDVVIENNGTLDDLYQKVNQVILDHIQF